MPRLLVVDEDLSKRIATELRRRGRTAKTVAALELKGWRDPLLLERLHEIDPDCVLISGDDDMPATHGADLKKYGTTVAVVHPWDPTRPLTEPEWEHEIVQKWAHRIEAQQSGTIWRYTLERGRRWTVRKRSLPIVGSPSA